MDYAKEFPVEKMCIAFKISRSGYYAWKRKFNTKESKKTKLDDLIKYEYEKSRGTYGSPRLEIVLNEKEYCCSRSTIARRMNRMGLQARKKRKFKVTTDSNHDFKIAPNYLNRAFNVSEIGTVWVSDITYIKVNQHWMYLTVIIDLADRMVLAWSLSKSMDAEQTVIKAFNQACAYRCPVKGFIFHSDRGVQYACRDFKAILKQWDAKQSMSRKGNCWDNAVAESFFKTLKVECIYRQKITSERMAQSLIFDYIMGWYNTVRIHSALGGLSPLLAFIKKSKYLYAA